MFLIRFSENELPGDAEDNKTRPDVNFHLVWGTLLTDNLTTNFLFIAVKHLFLLHIVHLEKMSSGLRHWFRPDRRTKT